jgi:sigma-E factor negative regulatory protein RseC
VNLNETCYNAEMNAPEARVVTTGSTFATVAVEAAACARCAAGRGCGAGLLQRGRTRLIQVRVADGLYLEPGDCVRLELEPLHLLRAAWLAYGLPLLAMVLSVAAATAMADQTSDLGVVAFGAVGLAAGLIAGRRILRRDGCLQHLTPVVSDRISGRDSVPGDATAAAPSAES